MNLPVAAWLRGYRRECLRADVVAGRTVATGVRNQMAQWINAAAVLLRLLFLSRGVNLWLAAVNPDPLKMIERPPPGAALGRGRMFFDLHKVLEYWQHSGERSSSTAG